VAEIQDAALRARLEALLPAENTDPVEAVTALGKLMVLSCQAVAGRAVTPADARRLIDLNVAAAVEMQRRASPLVGTGTSLTVRQSLQLLAAFSEGGRAPRRHYRDARRRVTSPPSSSPIPGAALR
jgi:hypothetical protein